MPLSSSPLPSNSLGSCPCSIQAIFLIVIVIAHIYIGSVGMEGAFDAVGTGEVDVNWAREHHSIWAEELESADKDGKPSGEAAGVPAE